MDRVNIKIKIPSGLDKQDYSELIAEQLELMAEMVRSSRGEMKQGTLQDVHSTVEYVHLREVR